MSENGFASEPDNYLPTNTLDDERARDIWRKHRDCSVAELDAISRKLEELKTKMHGHIETRLESGWPAHRHVEAYQKAHRRQPIVEDMAQRAALNGGDVPRWESVLTHRRVNLELRDYEHTGVNALRVLYYLLIQKGRDYDDKNDLFEAAGKILGGFENEIKPRSVGRRLRRGIQDAPNGSFLEDLPEIFSDVEEWRDWLDGKWPLEIEVDVSQDSA